MSKLFEAAAKRFSLPANPYLIWVLHYWPSNNVPILINTIGDRSARHAREGHSSVLHTGIMESEDNGNRPPLAGLQVRSPHTSVLSVTAPVSGG